jgi:hypothetical protein
MNQRLRRMGRYVVRPGWCQPPSDIVAPGERGSIHYESPSFMATHDDPLLMDTTLDPKPCKGGRHRRQR